MSAHAGKRLIFISAPAGFGKTISAALWLDWLGQKSAWLTLDARSGEELSFCRGLCRAIFGLQPDNGALGGIVSDQDFDAAPFEHLQRMAYALESEDEGAVLVIDDLHCISRDETLRELFLFCKRLPRGITVLILSRATPPERFCDLVVKNGLELISADDLRFTRDELRLFLSERCQAKAEPELDAAYEYTGGWPASINAPMLSSNGTGGDIRRYLSSYIRSNVWECWDEETREFLAKISVARELTPSLCQAVTGRADSGAILLKLLRENAFIRAAGEDSYQFYGFFRDFLSGELDRLGKRCKNISLKRAGDWLLEQGDYYQATEYYVRCRDHTGIARAIGLMFDSGSKYANVEATLAAINMSVTGDVLDNFPFLWEARAWAAYIMGRSEELSSCLDTYYMLLPKIVLKNPKSLQTMYLLRCIDPRNSLIEYLRKLHILPSKGTGCAVIPSISQNLPFFHRSLRDFSEYAKDGKERLSELKKTFGAIIGREFDVMLYCIRAGLSHEQGKPLEAHEYAVNACALLCDDYAPELKFCAHMMLSHIGFAAGRKDDAGGHLALIDEMICQDGADYLNYNLKAYRYRLRIADGDAGAAREWLEENAVYSRELPFYKLYGHFTTANAYIAAGRYEAALILLKSLLALAENYRRPLDVIEALILLSAAYMRAGSGKYAYEALEKAIDAARPYGYTQLFADYGRELAGMLFKLSRPGARLGADVFVKSIYMRAAERPRDGEGLEDEQRKKPVLLTARQRDVMRLMCDGYSYNGISERLGVKYATVRSHIEAIYKKLGVTNCVDAVIRAKSLNLTGE